MISTPLDELLSPIPSVRPPIFSTAFVISYEIISYEITKFESIGEFARHHRSDFDHTTRLRFGSLGVFDKL
ncbi:MAG: hypothetical protein V4689_00520 [Verrucomicrobiota bacterium]